MGAVKGAQGGQIPDRRGQGTGTGERNDQGRIRMDIREYFLSEIMSSPGTAVESPSLGILNPGVV